VRSRVLVSWELRGCDAAGGGLVGGVNELSLNRRV